MKSQCKFLWLFFFLCAFTWTLNAQVKTRIFNDSRGATSVIPLHLTEKIDPIILPAPDIESVLRNDQRNEREINRYGIPMETNFNEKDGIFYEIDGLSVWKLAIKSPGAKSLNFRLRNLNLPEQSLMYIYSKDEKIVIGPITERNIHSGKYTTDLVEQNEAIIQVIFPTRDKELFAIFQPPK